MKFIFKIILSTSLSPFVLSMAMGSEGQRDENVSSKEEYKNLRIIITPEMKFKDSPSEDQIVTLQKEAEELKIQDWDKKDFYTLSLAVYNATQEKEAKS